MALEVNTFQMTTMKPFKNAKLSLTASYDAVGSNTFNVHLAVKPPVSGDRQGIVVSLIFDVSGSMSTDACKVGDDALRFHTRIDLLKVVAELMTRMLGPEDTLCLITFSDNGFIRLEPTLMTDAGKALALQSIYSMTSSGSTNLWNSLEVANDVMLRPEFAESLRYAIMLTDGDESYPAPFRGGTVEGFSKLPRSYILNIFGFGSHLDSAKLSQLSQAAGGRFSNIADFMTLATTSINCLAIGLASCSIGDTVRVGYADGSVSEHPTSLIQYGQDRNIVFTTNKQPVLAGLMRGGSRAEFTSGLTVEANARMDLLDGLRTTIASNGSTGLATYLAIYSKYPGLAHVAELNTELTSACQQVNWNKWGKHYHLAYLQALENDHRMNFKEFGQAHLCGTQFETYKSIGDAVFSRIPKPAATGGLTTTYGGGYGYASPPPLRAVASVGSTNDPGAAGGCWAPGSMVRMADGTRKAIENVMPYDRVWTSTGSATVEYALELGTHLTPKQNMCQVGNLLLSWYHPVLTTSGVWVPPCTISPISVMDMPVLHNLIVSNGHVLDIDGTLTVSLGHGLTEEGVEHEFFGSKSRILDAIKLQPGFEQRRVVFKQLAVFRDPITSVIVGWFERFL